MGTIREPIVEGIFYPSDKEKLQHLVSSLIENATATRDHARAIIVPHAGYRYSGSIAAAAYKATTGRPVRKVIILAPIHRNPSDEVILPESDHFRLPTGIIPVDHGAVEEITTCSTKFRIDDIPHLEEHSIEVQLPFVQHLFPDAAIIPILVGKIRSKTVAVLAHGVSLVCETNPDECLIIVSSNLTSFMQGRDAKSEAEQIVKFILQKDRKSLLLAHEAGTINTCGASAIAVLLALTADGYESQVLCSGSSAEANNDFNELVHYAAIGFF